MKLSPPTTVVFIIALVIAAIGVLSALGTVAIVPIASVWIMAIAFAVLAVGCLIKGA